jgi:hypothetical protein
MRVEFPIATGTWYHVMSLDITQCHERSVPNHQGQMVLLHGFIKKTRQTPENDLDLAVKRQKEVEGGKAAK